MKRALLLITAVVASLLPMAPAVAGTCDWDTSAGWVARENALPGAKQWDLGAPVRMSADFSRRVNVKRIEGWFGFIAFLHIAGCLLMWKATSGRYELSDGSLFGWGTAALAYVLGMRHAFDADHISAIDNTTRKLMSEGQRPLAVGFFFSLGHSSVVFALALLLNFGIKALG